MSALTDIALADFNLNPLLLQRLEFERPPTWDEVFEAVQKTVAAAEGMKLDVGGVSIAAGSRSGRILLHAGIVASILNVLFNDDQGVCGGGIRVGNTDIATPDLGGDFYVWNVVRHNDEFHIVDMGHGAVGAHDYVAARLTTAEAAGIHYRVDDDFTDQVCSSLAHSYFRKQTVDTMTALRNKILGVDKPLIETNIQHFEWDFLPPC